MVVDGAGIAVPQQHNADGTTRKPSAPRGFKNREKVLVLGTRGITSRSRHLMNDLLLLLPHSKKDVKLDTKSDRHAAVEVAGHHAHLVHTICLYSHAAKHTVTKL